LGSHLRSSGEKRSYDPGIAIRIAIREKSTEDEGGFVAPRPASGERDSGSCTWPPSEGSSISYNSWEKTSCRTGEGPRVHHEVQVSRRKPLHPASPPRRLWLRPVAESAENVQVTGSQLRFSAEKRSCDPRHLIPIVASAALIRVIHVSELRAALNEARTALGLPFLTFTDGTLVPDVTVVRAVHIQALRDGL
jgi:hypothetical protein